MFRKNGQTSVVTRIKISDTTGAAKTGLAYNTSGLIISAIANNEATSTNYTVAASNIEDITTLGTYAAPSTNKCRFKEVDATYHPGVYEIHLANSRWSVSNAEALIVTVTGTGLNAASKEVQLVSFNPYDAAALGLSRIDVALSTLATAANLATVAGYVDTEVAAIKAKTDNLPSDPADASDIAALFSALDTSLGAIADDVDFINSTLSTVDSSLGTLSTDVASIGSVTSQLTFTVTNELDVNVQSINDVTILGGGVSGNLFRGS